MFDKICLKKYNLLTSKSVADIKHFAKILVDFKF